MSSIFDLLRSPAASAPAAAGAVSFVVVGLGNPGREYENTRHNAGFLAMDRIALSLHTELRTARFHALCAETVVGGRKILLLKPQTYMNLSGQAVKEALAYYKLTPERLIVFSDDVNLDVGRTRVRRSGSDGGQKGLRSIITCLGTDAFPRMRIGVGQKPERWDMADWVLSRFSTEERKLIDGAAERCADALPLLLEGEIEKAMGLYNGK